MQNKTTSSVLVKLTFTREKILAVFPYSWNDLHRAETTNPLTVTIII